MNLPAVLGVFRIIRDPSLCLPHYTISTFDRLPVPVSTAFKNYQHGDKEVNIKAVVLDKDNCFAAPDSITIHPPYSDKFKALMEEYSPSNILIVSNSSGSLHKDPKGIEADLLERNTGIKVLRHSSPKPACWPEILAHFNGRVTSPAQIAVVGDRLFTDVIMAKDMGAYSIWIREGVIPDRGFVTRIEYGLSKFLANRGFVAPPP